MKGDCVQYSGTCFTHVLSHRRFRPGFNEKDNQILLHKASSASRKSAPTSRFQSTTKTPLRHATFRPRATAAFLVHIARFSRGHHHHQCPRPLTSILISVSTASNHSLDNATTHALLLDVFALERHRCVCPNLNPPLLHLLSAASAFAAHNSSRWCPTSWTEAAEVASTAKLHAVVWSQLLEVSKLLRFDLRAF